MCAGVSDLCVCLISECAWVCEGLGVRMLGCACVHVSVGMCEHVHAYVRVRV